MAKGSLCNKLKDCPDNLRWGIDVYLVLRSDQRSILQLWFYTCMGTFCNCMLIHVQHGTADGGDQNSGQTPVHVGIGGYSVSLDGHRKLHVSHFCIQRLWCFLSAAWMRLASEELY